jgi:hypothetical protein
MFEQLQRADAAEKVHVMRGSPRPNIVCSLRRVSSHLRGDAEHAGTERKPVGYVIT